MSLLLPKNLFVSGGKHHAPSSCLSSRFFLFLVWPTFFGTRGRTYDTYSTIDFLKVHEQQIIERDSQMFILWDQENENGFLQALKSNKVPKSASYIFRVMQHMTTRLVTSVWLHRPLRKTFSRLRMCVSHASVFRARHRERARVTLSCGHERTQYKHVMAWRPVQGWLELHHCAIHALLILHRATPPPPRPPAAPRARPNPDHVWERARSTWERPHARQRGDQTRARNTREAFLSCNGERERAGEGQKRHFGDLVR